MKKACAICAKSKGKRACKQKDGIICPPCCAAIRNSSCADCLHFKASEIYEASKPEYFPQNSFIAAVDEEIEETLDQAMDLVEKGSLEEAENIVAGLLRDNPRYHSTHFSMGVIHIERKRWDEALSCFEKAIDIFPYFWEAHFNKASVCLKKYDLKNAVLAYRRVVEIGDPDEKEVKHAKNFLSDLEQDMLENDGIDLDSYLKSSDRFEQALSCMDNQEWENAIGCFKGCLNIIKRHVQSYGNIGLCHLQLGQKEPAIKAFNQALEIDPDYELAIVNRSLAVAMKDGEKPEPGRIETVDYYKDYPMKGKSYIRSFIQNIKQSLHKKKRQSKTYPSE